MKVVIAFSIMNGALERTFQLKEIGFYQKTPGFWPAIWMLRHNIYDENGTPWYGTLHCDAGHSGNPIYTKGLQLIGKQKK